jgi:hypothetical protein
MLLGAMHTAYYVLCHMNFNQRGYFERVPFANSISDFDIRLHFYRNPITPKLKTGSLLRNYTRWSSSPRLRMNESNY